MLLKYSLTATIRPAPVVIHARRTMTPSRIAPNPPYASDEMYVSKKVPRFCSSGAVPARSTLLPSQPNETYTRPSSRAASDADLIVPNNRAFLLLTPVSRMAFNTMTEKAIAAIASIVRYPSVKPAVKGASVLNSAPAGLTGLDMYMVMAVITSRAIEINSNGVSTLPMLSAIVPGFQLKAKTTTKNTKENINRDIPLGPSRKGITPISYAVVAVLGMAKNGPIVK